MAQNANPFTFEAQFEPVDASVKTLTWKSDNTAVAMVNENGTVTPVGQGECTITATTTDGTELSASATVTVTAPVSTDFDFDLSDLGAGLDGLTLELGESYQLKPKASEPDAVLPENISWSSSNPQIASVSVDGTVTALSLGQATITASATVYGQEVSASSTVTVITPLAKSLSISPSQLMLDDRASEILTAEYSPAEAMPGLEWTVDDQSVIQLTPMADRNQIVITALSPGNATVTVTATDGSGLEATCVVTVKAVPVTALSLNIENNTIDLQDAPMKMLVTIYPQEATVPPLRWTSSDETVAAVLNHDGLEATLTPLSAGKTTVTVTHADDTSISDSAEITVTDKSSIGDIFTDGTFYDAPVDVYDLSGRLIRRQATQEQLQDLRPGIYIFRQGNTSKKVFIQ